MGMTFAQQKSKLARLLGDSDTGSEAMWPLTDREFEINRGEVNLAEDSRSFFGFATGTVSSQAISLPTGFLGIHMLVVNDEVMTGLREMPLQDYERFINSGDERYYFWTNASGVRQILFIDSASDGQDYKLYYWKKPTTDLSGDDDESPFQDQFREASVYYAASELFPQTGKIKLTEYYRKRYELMANQARIETEKLFLNNKRAFPDIEGAFIKDADQQGIGTVGGIW